MKTFHCNVCEYIYRDIKTERIEDRVKAFESLPEDWECPECGSGKIHITCRDDNEKNMNSNYSKE